MLQVAEPAAAAGPVGPRLFRVRGRRRETRDTVTVDLQAVAPADESGFTPGQFNMLYVFGIGEVPLSIRGAPRPVPAARPPGEVRPHRASLARAHAHSYLPRWRAITVSQRLVPGRGGDR